MWFCYSLGGEQQRTAFLISRQHRVEQALGAARSFLRDRPNFPVARPGHLAAIRPEFPQDHLQQRGFTCAVPAYEADTAAHWKIGSSAGADPWNDI